MLGKKDFLKHIIWPQILAKFIDNEMHNTSIKRTVIFKI